MKMWEYAIWDMYEDKAILPTDGEMEETLNSQGKRGWELVEASWQRITSGTWFPYVYRTIWKREIGG